MSLTGEYWVDPNDGDPRDAILVHCDMKLRATCILPKPDRTPETTFDSKEHEVWLGDADGGMKVSVLLCTTVCQNNFIKVRTAHKKFASTKLNR